MQVDFESRDPRGESLREAAVRRVRLAMRQLSWLHPRARVELSDVEGVSDGIDKCCRVELTAEGVAPVVITSITRDWRASLQSALSRAVRALLHSLPRPAQLAAPGGAL